MRFEYRSDVRESLAAMNQFFQSVLETYRHMDNVQVECELLGERPCTGDVDKEKQSALENKAADLMEAFTGKRPQFYSGSTDPTSRWPRAFLPSASAAIWRPAPIRGKNS